MEVIGISGGAGTGKDYIYDTVLRPLGFNRVSLADHFKNGIIGRGLATYEEVHITKPPHIRTLLQEEGTERGRNLYGEQVWCNTLGTWLKHWERTWGMDKFCVTDVRFPNEVKFVQDFGGVVYRIGAPKRYAANNMADDARQHPSETALNDYEGFDGVIYNDFDDTDMPEQVFSLLISAQLVGSRNRPLSIAALRSLGAGDEP